MAKPYIFLVVSLLLEIFFSFSLQARKLVTPFHFEKDWAGVEKIIKETPHYLLIPEEDGGFPHTREYFQQDFMETYVTRKGEEITGFINYTEQPEKYCAFYYAYIGHKKTPDVCKAYKKLHYLHIIAVSKDHTRQGIASSLVQHAKKRLSKKPIFIDIMETNEASRSFFTRKGFEPVNLENLGLEEEKEEGSVYMISR